MKAGIAVMLVLVASLVVVETADAICQIRR